MSTLTIFTLICGLFCVVAVLAVCWPLVKGRPNSAQEEASRHDQVLMILRAQKAELDKEKAQGSIDNDEYEETKSEIERRVVEETRSHAGQFEGPTVWTKVIAAVIAVIMPAATVLGYFVWGRYTAMDEEFVRLMEQQQIRQKTGHSSQELNANLSMLVDTVKKNPDDANAWFLLARTYETLGRFNDAVDAYQEVNRIVPNNANILANMADVMAAANGKVITPDVVAVLEKALRIDPNQWKALLLMAINAWDKQNYVQAIDYWERVLRVTPADFPERAQIKENIREAKRLGGIADKQGGENAKPVPTVGADSSEAPSAQRLPAPETVKPVASTSPFLEGTVSLAENLKGKVKPEDPVFIYARPVSGSRMPVAYLRITARDLPYHFKLTDKTAMATGTSTLRDTQEVIVGARLSPSGNFMPQEGDIEGENPQSVKVGTTGLVIELSHER